MVEGVAEYRPPGEEPTRILLRENAIKAMDATFPGRPVFVDHVPEVNIEKLGSPELIPDGYVVESFFNKTDGKHWAKFVITTEKAQQAIDRGETLSNAYIVKASAPGDRWHNVDYSQEVMEAEYEHLAIVAKPRYEESIVLTPEQFKDYNAKKEAELTRLTNSKEEGLFTMFKFFKREAVQNSKEIENAVVRLDSGKEFTIEELAKYVERVENMSGYASDEHMVKLANGEMSVKELAEKYNSMCKKNAEDEEAAKKKNAEEEEKKENESDEEAKKKALELAAHEEKEIAAKKNAEEEEKKKNSPVGVEGKDVDPAAVKNAKEREDFFKSLGDAAPKSVQNDIAYEMRSDKVSRGKERY
jgi:hypothetical protein